MLWRCSEGAIKPVFSDTYGHTRTVYAYTSRISRLRHISQGSKVEMRGIKVIYQDRHGCCLHSPEKGRYIRTQLSTYVSTNTETDTYTVYPALGFIGEYERCSFSMRLPVWKVLDHMRLHAVSLLLFCMKRIPNKKIVCVFLQTGVINGFYVLKICRISLSTL